MGAYRPQRLPEPARMIRQLPERVHKARLTLQKNAAYGVYVEATRPRCGYCVGTQAEGPAGHVEVLYSVAIVTPNAH